jgi:hypothetical protein
MLSINFQGIGHPSTYSIFQQTQFDPALTAGSSKTTFLFAVLALTLCQLAVQQIFSHSKIHINQLSGDGGI